MSDIIEKLNNLLGDNDEEQETIIQAVKEIERLRKRCAEFYHRALVAEGQIDQYVNVEDFYE